MVTINKNFLPPTIVRFLLILFQLAGLISAAAVFKPNIIVYSANVYYSTRAAYLTFSVLGFLISIAIFVFIFFNIANSSTFANIPSILIILITDVIWFIPTISVAIASAIREDTIQKYKYYNFIFNNGAFGAASFFAFACCILYAVDAFLMFLEIKKNGMKARVNPA